jgi:hypothetical protein
MAGMSSSVKSAADAIGVVIPEQEIEEYETLLSKMENALKVVSEMDGWSPRCYNQSKETKESLTSGIRLPARSRL